jgi:hypothetical protein
MGFAGRAIIDRWHLSGFVVICTICISKALQNGYVDSLIHGLALGKKLVMHQTLRFKESYQHCRDI